MELVNLVQSGGPYALAAILAFLYWAERTERKEWQEKYDALSAQFLERLISGLNSASQATREGNTALQTLHTTFQNVIFRLRGTPHNEGE
jgi:hypothetical protein